ncbi:transcriptional regulator, partial [Klebsiella pneumoniae]|nr:transcriptional regulator [Klebsiella pneumoniae]
KFIEVAGIRVVNPMDRRSPCPDFPVGFDNFEAARQMPTAIIARGHCHIAYLGARLDERTIITRTGYDEGTLDAGLVPVSVLVD